MGNKLKRRDPVADLASALCALISGLRSFDKDEVASNARMYLEKMLADLDQKNYLTVGKRAHGLSNYVVDAIPDGLIPLYEKLQRAFDFFVVHVRTTQ